ncbi:MAG TPA: hypothetical protein VHA75_07275 [Rugosimonospora sp.]|nr:hypothetical protein [Rugosimonospora sp.]
MPENDPTPAAPANTPAPPAAPEPGAPTPATPPAPAPAPFDPASLTPEAKRYLDEQIAAADKKARTTSKENAANEARTALLAEIAEKLGLAQGDDGPPDPAKLTEQIEAQQAALWKSDTEKQILRLGARAGIDADALMDSSRGMDALAEALDKRPDITDLDPNGAEFARELERALGEVAEQFPRFKTAG